MGSPSFWDNTDRAQKHIAKLNTLKRTIVPVAAFQKKVDDLDVMVELAETASPGEIDSYAKELTASVAAMGEELDQLEIASFLTGQFDKNNAILSIQSGAGGTESNDWADILFRMYSRWAERRGYTIEVQDVQAGDQAGISKATMLIKGENAYGYVKAERGVHRLVRISPFDANKRRHTSFCAIDVVALRSCGFWPVMAVRSRRAPSISLESLAASPTPMLTTTLTTPGICMGLV